MAQLAGGFHLFVESVVRHFRQKVENDFVSHSVVESDVETILFGDVAIFGRTFERRGFRNAGQKFVLEVNLGEVAKIFGHSFRFDGADLAVVSLRIVGAGKGLVEAGLQRVGAKSCRQFALARRHSDRLVQVAVVVFVLFLLVFDERKIIFQFFGFNFGNS